MRQAFDDLFVMEERMNEICDKMMDADDEQMTEYMEELGTIQDMLTNHDFYMIDAKVEEVARALGLLELGLDKDVTDLSGGQRTKVLLGKPVSYTHLLSVELIIFNGSARRCVADGRCEGCLLPLGTFALLAAVADA